MNSKELHFNVSRFNIENEVNTECLRKLSCVVDIMLSMLCYLV